MTKVLDNVFDDMGMGQDDGLGDYFEKNLRFIDYDGLDYEIHDVKKDKAKTMANEDPELFFYSGLHKEYGDLEAKALEKMIEKNAKFFFIFKYHTRDEPEFTSLLQAAAEALSIQDARAFFYYHMHHDFPELGRGSIIQLIDTNPDSFFDLGLQKDYPDFEESASAARNIKDPHKVELEQPEWLSVGKKLSYRDVVKFAEEEVEEVVLSDSEKKVFDFFSKAISRFNLKTTVRVAGGWVRDKVMKKNSKDIDIAVDNMMGKKFAEHMERYAKMNGIPISIGIISAKPEQGKNMETAVIHIFGEEIEVVNLRDEEYDEGSRTPKTVITDSPMKDAYRRDLTINSLFYNIDSGEIEDFTGQGIDDIHNGVIRSPVPQENKWEELGINDEAELVTPKKTYLDDPLRVLRTIRFANRYGFDVDQSLIDAARDPEVQDAFRKKISKERMEMELRKIMSENKSPSYALNLLTELGYRDFVLELPENYSEWEMDQKNPHHEHTVWGHLMEALDNIYEITKNKDFSSVDRYITNWAVLLHDVGKLDPSIVGTKEVGNEIVNTYYGHEESSKVAAEYLLRRLKGTRIEDIHRIQMLIESAGRMNPNHVDSSEDSYMKGKTLGKIMQLTNNFKDDWKRAIEVAVADASSHKKDWLKDYNMNYWDSLSKSFSDMPENTSNLKPILNGKEVMEIFDRKPGKWVGEVNKAMLDFQMDNPEATKAEAASFIKQFYEKNNIDKFARMLSKRHII